MSRGGRGGRGGARGGRPNVPWDTGDEPDSRPSELFPPRLVPMPRPLSARESAGLKKLLLLRHQMHMSTLYTSKHTPAHDPAAPRKLYGQAQVNAQYGARNKVSVDPFSAVPTFSQMFARQERALPDWTARPVCRELFPLELLDTVEPQDGAGIHKKRRLALSTVRALPDAEQAFGMPSLGSDPERDLGHGQGVGSNPFDDDAATSVSFGRKNLLEKIDAIPDDDSDDAAELDDDQPLDAEDGDEAYDDEDAGDYDAENYFDNGDDAGDDYGDGDDGEGTY